MSIKLLSGIKDVFYLQMTTRSVYIKRCICAIILMQISLFIDFYKKTCDSIDHNVLFNKFHELVVHSLPGLIKCLHGLFCEM